MAKNKTVETAGSVSAYLDTISDEKRRADCKVLVDIFEKASGFEPKMWGAAIVGFGTYHYKYDSGHEGDAPLAGLSSRASAITLYLASAFADKEDLLSKLGKHKVGKACIYVKKLEDVDTIVLQQMVKNSVEWMRRNYPE